MHMGFTRPGAGWTPLKAEIVVGWHRGLEYCGSIPARRIGVSQIANKPTARPQAAIGHEYCVGYALSQ